MGVAVLVAALQQLELRRKGGEAPRVAASRTASMTSALRTLKVILKVFRPPERMGASNAVLVVVFDCFRTLDDDTSE